MIPSLDAALVYERYIALHRLAAKKLNAATGTSLGGRMLLYGDADEYGSACALAASIAGAASLGITANTEQLKLAVRNGVCDFLVNALDEALRILKNEIRKKQPVSVCLEQPLDETMREIAARGVQPDILALTAQDVAGSGEETALLLQRGAVELPVSPVQAAPGREGVRWSVAELPALWLPKVDAAAADVLGDELRCRWLRLAPRYLGRRALTQRYVEMTDRETESFLAAIRVLLREGKLGEGRIETAVTVEFHSGEERLTLAR
ncbi:MAG TPA: hypothetical protein VM554_06120 [Acidisarcina sp.]|nr:hypothetical protein [Acidisarcina sp.]